MIRQDAVRNGLLRALSNSAFENFREGVDAIELDAGTFLEVAGEDIENAYFLESGVAYVAVRCGKTQSEAGLIGREGLVGASLALGVNRTPYDVVTLSPGTALRIPAQVLAETLRRHSDARSVLLHYNQVRAVQVTSAALACGQYNLEERLARLLLMLQDRSVEDHLRITHEQLSMLLGVRRPGVTVATHILEGLHIIRATRGNVRILDRTQLMGLADTSYGDAEAEYERLIGTRAHADATVVRERVPPASIRTERQVDAMVQP